MYLEKFNLDGRVAVVTGGGRAIGLACCHALAEAGAKVVIADVDRDVAESGRAEMKGAGFDADVEIMDVTNSEQVTRVADDVVARHGAVDILVANAGIARSGTPAEEVEDELWLNVNDVNLNGVFWCNRAFGRHMLARNSGAIVNIGSMSGFIVNRPQQQSYYNASKAAVHHLTRSLATEWADRGVRVNAVAPTYIDTPLVWAVEGVEEMMKDWLRDTPMGRLGRPDEIASVVHFLASDASSIMTGSIVSADAGFISW
ncbi:SDR family NAD(P)-dependent oxidoreductase [Bauldia litoralis]|uniref:NAD(P)-dependent dehydrogenase, short-chain alcohol dehydrogenase family n=1 Tax=Bauldia litoralis TaxID=665467 RepID=A0A1G6A7T1_9HYPH|nr:glucose 1-dehydrogenase [Bauldia litoralis]SDB04340.1 NAD(P)-dependent dehydrogenase, short-chain alcohol dehydrogenase family [Bauldia litoralis]